VHSNNNETSKAHQRRESFGQVLSEEAFAASKKKQDINAQQDECWRMECSRQASTNPLCL